MQAFEAKHICIASTLRNQACLMCIMQKKHEDAEKWYKQALVEAKKGFGEEDPHVGAACNNMAEHYRLTKQWQLARPMYDEVPSLCL